MTNGPLRGRLTFSLIGPLDYTHTWVRTISGGIDARFDPLRSYVDKVNIIGFQAKSKPLKALGP